MKDWILNNNDFRSLISELSHTIDDLLLFSTASERVNYLSVPVRWLDSISVEKFCTELITI